ncbi:MAG TPA: hypothetical protein VKU94_03945 [Geobacterales bacterium]|nr:hypothetical protein [Geobacterales bacterium]
MVVLIEGFLAITETCEKYGERPIAVIKLRKGMNISKEEIIQYLNKAVEDGRIAKWWLPEEIIFTDEIQLTSTGKINKLELKRKFTTHYNTAS